jgi:hypothetical protein
MARPKKGAEGESTSAYWRRVFEAHPEWLRKRSNARPLQQWKEDHPGTEEVPTSVRQVLSNIKSQMRKGKRRRQRPAAEAANGARPAARVPVAVLERLEGMIDDCLTLARAQGPAALDDVIRVLRRARNEVVLKQGPRG